MLIASWNVNSLKARLPRLEPWLDDVQPDVLCLQETKLADADFPEEVFTSRGYEVVFHGEGRWNGVAIASKLAISDPVSGFASSITPDSDARLVSANCGKVRVNCVYVPNGRSLDDDHYQYKLDWLSRLHDHLDVTAKSSHEVVVAGDWNVAPADIDVWNVRSFENSTHVSQPERAALEKLATWGLVDTLRRRYSNDQLFSYYDYRAGCFHKRQGMRIDSIMCSAPLAERSVVDLIDRNARKGTKPSDHAPVLAYYAD